MRPDLEDFDDLNEQEVGPRSKAMSWLVLGVALFGFVSLGYYAYHSGSQSIHEASIAVVEADPSPIKSEPEDRQGEHFPNQDKTIYDAIAADDAGNGTPHVEKLLPEAEQAMVPQVVAEPTSPVRVNEKTPHTTTFVNSSSKAVAAESKPVDQPIQHVIPAAEMIAPLSDPVKPVMKAPPPPAAVAAAAIRASDFDKKPVQAVKEMEIAASEDGADESSPSEPEMVNVKSVTPGSKPTSEAKDDQSKAAKSAVTSATGNYKVQLGAFKSETEALTQWKKIVAKNSDVLHGAAIVVKADLPSGTFYRLRASGYASADAAKAACAKLALRGQACFPAGK